MEGKGSPIASQISLRPGDAERVAELKEQGANIPALTFYRCLYEAGVLEPPARAGDADPGTSGEGPYPRAA